MLKVLMVYFSGTGVTRYFADLIQEEMEKRGYECDSLDLEELVDLPTLWQKNPVALNYTIRAEEKRPLGKYPWPYQRLKTALLNLDENPLLANLNHDWHEYDLIGFGSPVYSFRPAPVMIRFLLDLPLFSKKTRAFSFTTHDGAQGDYEAFMRKILTMKGFKYVGHIDQSFVYSATAIIRKKFDHLKTGKLLVKKSYQARKNIFLFLEYIHSIYYGVPYWYKGTNLLDKMVGIPYRLAYSYGVDFILNHLLFGFGVDRSECIQCWTCIQQCPQGLIEVDDEDFPVRHYHCMYCLRCLNWCPTSALYFSKLTKDKARFPGPEVLLDAVMQNSLDDRLKKDE